MNKSQKFKAFKQVMAAGEWYRQGTGFDCYWSKAHFRYYPDGKMQRDIYSEVTNSIRVVEWRIDNWETWLLRGLSPLAVMDDRTNLGGV